MVVYNPFGVWEAEEGIVFLSVVIRSWCVRSGASRLSVVTLSHASNLCVLCISNVADQIWEGRTCCGQYQASIGQQTAQVYLYEPHFCVLLHLISAIDKFNVYCCNLIYSDNILFRLFCPAWRRNLHIAFVYGKFIRSALLYSGGLVIWYLSRAK